MVPPAVAGIGLLARWGPRGCWGRSPGTARAPDGGRGRRADVRGQPVLHPPGAGRVRRAGPHRLEASRTLGAGDGRIPRVALPGARPAWGPARRWPGAGRWASSAPRWCSPAPSGVTQTAPLAIYERFANDFTGALALSAVLVAVRRRAPLASSSRPAPRVAGARARGPHGSARGAGLQLSVAAGGAWRWPVPPGRARPRAAGRGRPAATRRRPVALRRRMWLDTGAGVDLPPEERRWASCSRTTPCSRT